MRGGLQRVRIKKGFPAVTKYLGLTLVFVRNSALREGLIAIFRDFFVIINKIPILAWRSGNSYIPCL